LALSTLMLEGRAGEECSALRVRAGRRGQVRRSCFVVVDGHEEDAERADFLCSIRWMR